MHSLAPGLNPDIPILSNCRDQEFRVRVRALGEAARQRILDFALERANGAAACYVFNEACIDFLSRVVR